MDAYLAIVGDSSDDDDLLLQTLGAYAEELDREADEGTSERVPRAPRMYLHRDREGAGMNLWNDYFSENPTYPPHKFKRRFRMRSQLFLRIIQGISEYSVTPLPAHFDFFKQRVDATGRQGFNIYQKCTSALRQLAYGTSGDMFDEYLKMSEQTSLMCLDNFCLCVTDLYRQEYLRKPTAHDIQRIYEHHAAKHGFPGMLGSIDCMHWEWKNCPVAWQGQFTSGHNKKPSIILEAVASYDMWIWHAYFGVAGSNNDINVLNRSPLFDSIKNGTAPPAPFTVNGHDYTHGYYLADGIYPDWATLIKAFSSPTDEQAAKYTRFQESARKDVERTFGVLQGRFNILRVPGRTWKAKKMSRILYCCVLLHNMIQEDNGFAITSLDEEYLREPENRPAYVRNRNSDRATRTREIRDRNVHNQLRADLTEHIWALPPNFRRTN